MLQTLKLREAFGLPDEPKIDAEKGILRGVKVLGLVSQNGKRYTKDAIKGALPLLEGARVYFNHPDGDDNARKIEDRFARLREAKQDDKGEAYADLHFNPHHDRAASFVWFAKNDPAGIGLSINGSGKGSIDGNGMKLVEQITKIHSVDIVDGPATVAGLFEQDGYTPPPDPAAASQEGGEMGNEFRTKLADLASHVVSDSSMSKDDCLKKLKQIVAMLEEEGASDDGEEGEVEATPEAEEKAMEQLKKLASPAAKWAFGKLAAVKLLEKKQSLREQATAAGLAEKAITETFVETLLREATAEGVAKLIEDRKSVATSAPRYTPRDETPSNGKPRTAKEIADSLFRDVGESGA